MNFKVETIEDKWTPPPPDANSPLEQQYDDFSFETSVSHKAISECNPIIIQRLEKWTADLKTFSKNVLPYARITAQSNAYSLGNIVSQDNFLDSGISAKAEDISQKNVPNPAHTFRLQWHRAILHEKLGDLKLSGEDVDRMTILQALQTLHDIVRITSNDPNFTKQPERYPNIMNIASLARNDAS